MASHNAAAAVAPPFASAFPGRETECSRVTELLAEPLLALPLYIHGPSGCGKSAVLRAALEHLKIPTAYVDCVACPTAQALFDSALNQLAGHRPSSSNGYASWAPPCDSIGAFVAGLRRLVEARGRVCLVFDKAERLAGRSGGLLKTLIELPNLLAAAAAAAAAAGGLECESVAGQVLPVFVGEALWGDFQRHCEGDPRVVHVRFPGYMMEALGNVLKRDVDAALPRGHVLRRKLEHRAQASTRATGGGGGGSGSSDPASGSCGGVLSGGSGGADSGSDQVGAAQTTGGDGADGEESGGGGAAAAAAAPVHADAFESFVPLFVDTFSEVCRDTHELRYLCRQLFPVYVQPAAEGEVPLDDAHHLYAKAGPHLKRALKSVYSRDGLLAEETAASLAEQAGASAQAGASRLSAAAAGRGGASRSVNPLTASVQLPTVAQYLLLAGFLASRLPARADVAFFSSAPRRPGRRGSGPRNARLSDTPHAFLLERLLAIHTSITPPEPPSIAAANHHPNASGGGGGGGGGSSSGAGIGGGGLGGGGSGGAELKAPIRAELLVQVASLVDLRLFSRASKDSVLDGMRLRCEAPKELVRSVAAGLNFDLRQYEEE